MNICIAQIKPIKGDVHKNIKKHLQLINHAAGSESDLIVFPELSITGYEPTLASKLATNVSDNIFDSFQEISNKQNITISVGMPIITNDGIKISMLIFQPNKKRTVYSKQRLHSDELPYFTSGTYQTFITIRGYKIAFGICYESLQREHFLQAKQNDADIYIASVAKSEDGVRKAYQYFPKTAKEFNTPILMSNCIGDCDTFTSAGQSAVWNGRGILIRQLDSKNEGILVYNVESQKVEIPRLK